MGLLTSGTVTNTVFNNMLDRVTVYKNKNKVLPKIVYIIKGGKDYVTIEYFTTMFRNFNKYFGVFKKEQDSIQITNKTASYIDTTAGFNMGSFINPEATPLKDINWKALKTKGITEVYIRIMETTYPEMGKWVKPILAAGLKPFAWIWQGFRYSKQVVDMGYHICFDLETYKMTDYLNEVKAIRVASTGKTFIICTKPDGWDGNQGWDLLVRSVDYIMPMLYLGDYMKTVEQLASYMKTYNLKYPNKIYPVLETYVSDAHVISKSRDVLMSEINAVQGYCKGIGLFRYGLSNY